MATDTDLDELFGEEGGAPSARTTLVLALLVGGLFTAITGLVCTTAPGGLLVLAAWLAVEKEVDRVESGYLSVELRDHVLRLQRLAYAGLVFVILLFIFQIVLLSQGFYEWLWGMGIEKFWITYG